MGVTAASDHNELQSPHTYCFILPLYLVDLEAILKGWGDLKMIVSW